MISNNICCLNERISMVKRLVISNLYIQFSEVDKRNQLSSIIDMVSWLISSVSIIYINNTIVVEWNLLEYLTSGGLNSRNRNLRLHRSNGTTAIFRQRFRFDEPKSKSKL